MAKVRVSSNTDDGAGSRARPFVFSDVSRGRSRARSLRGSSAVPAACSTAALPTSTPAKPVAPAPPPKDDGKPAQGGPGGDGHSAALEQLRVAPLAPKTDKQNSVVIPLPDATELDARALSHRAGPRRLPLRKVAPRDRRGVRHARRRQHRRRRVREELRVVGDALGRGVRGRSASRCAGRVPVDDPGGAAR